MSLPRRWEHTKGVAAQAIRLAPLLEDGAEVLEIAAVLHDIGYAPALAETRFHPLDGARYLRRLQGVDDRVTRLVANHSFALIEADERGLRSELATEFPILEDRLLIEALVYCDMTTTPDGRLTAPESRLKEIVSRYGPESVVGRFIRQAGPEILACTERVGAAAAAAGIRP